MKSLKNLVRLIATLVLPLALTGCFDSIYPYRITIAVEVAGELLTASTIQYVVFFRTGDANGKSVTNSGTEGVPAVLDLGEHGWLAAAPGRDWNEWKRRQAKYNLECKEPKFLSEIVPNAGGINGSPDTVPTKLPWWNMPAFVWFPAGRPYTDAVQLCPEEFTRVIGPDVKFVSVSIMQEPGAKKQEKLDVKAPWLDEMRADKMNGTSRRSADEEYVFKPFRGNFETHGAYD